MTRPTGTTVRLLFVATVLAAIVAIGMAGLAASAGAAGDASTESTTNQEQINTHWDWKDDGEIKDASAVVLLNDLKGDGAMLVQTKYKTSPKTDVTITVTGADGTERTIERRGLGFTQRSYIFLGAFDGAKYPVEVTISTPEETVSGTLTERKERVQLVEAEPPEPVDLDLSLADEELEVGESTEATVTATYDDETTEDVTGDAVIVSNDTDVATVDNGVVTAEGPGAATITAEFDGLSDSAALTVTEPPEAAFFDVTIDETNSPITEGETLEVDATVENTGMAAGTQDVTLAIDDTVEDTETVSLERDESTSLTLEWETEETDAGDYTATVASQNDSATADVTVQADVPVPASFDAYVAGEDGYLHTGVDEDTEPIEFTRCADFEPTQQELDETPDYLPEPECIEAWGEIDAETNTWEGDFEFPTTVMEEQDDTLGDVYVEADIDTDEDGASGTWNHQTGEISAEMTVNIDVAIYNVDHGDDFDDLDPDDAITNPECHVPDVSLAPSTEKSYETGSPFPDTDVVEGERLANDEAFLVANDFPVGGAQDCGSLIGIDINEIINDELGIPAEAGESEVAFDLNFEFDVDPQPFFEVEIDDTNSPITEGETLSVDASVANTGDAAGTQDVTLDIDGTEVDADEIALDAGEETTTSLEWETEETDAGDYTATVSSDDDADSVEVTVDELPLDPADFQVEITDTNSPVTEGETLTVDATIENVGEATDTQSIELDIDGDLEDATDVTLGEDETEDVTLEWATEENDASSHTATVSSDNDSDSVEVTVEERPPEVANFQVEITDTNSPVTEGETLTVDASIVNVGEATDTQDIELDIDGTLEDATEVTLGEDESEEVTLEWATEENDASSHTATVSSDNDSDSVKVTVEELPPEPADFQVEITDTNSPVTEGETLTVDASIENVGEATDTQSIDLDIDGDLKDTTEVTLGEDETEEVTLEWATEENDASSHTATVSSDNDSDSVEVTVEELPPEPADFQVEITDTNSPVTEGETLTVDATIENVGEATDTQDIELDIDGTLEDATEVTLGEDESTEVTLEWATEVTQAGNYTATVSSLNDSDSVAISVGPADLPGTFDAYVGGVKGYLHTGVDDPNTTPIEFTECEDFAPTQDAIDEEPDYLPDPECIEAYGDIDHASNTWEGDFEFPTTVMEEEDDTLGDVYVEADIDTDEDGASGTWDHQTGEITAEMTVNIEVNIYNVDEHGVEWEEVDGDEDIRVNDEGCHLPDVAFEVSSEKSYETNSTFPDEDVVTGERFADDAAFIVANDFPVDGAQDCGEVFNIDINEIINEELGVPADAGENEVAFDLFFEMDPEPEAEFAVDVTETNSPVTEGETLTVDATVENVGEVEGTQDITLDIGDTTADVAELTLDDGASEVVSLAWKTAENDAGSYTATVSSADDSDSVEVTVDEAEVGPDAFDAYVGGVEGYLHTGVDDPETTPIEFTECEDFAPTQDAIDEEPDYLPDPECIEAYGDIDHETNSWAGDFEFPTTVMEEEDDTLGDVYVEADIDTDEDGASGIWDHQTGEISAEMTVNIDVNIYNVDSHGVPWEDVDGDEDIRVNDDGCHLPDVAFEVSSEKSYETNSSYPDTDTVTGDRLADDEAFLVANDFPVEGAQDCGDLFGLDINEIINDELGVPADAGENEVAFDLGFAFEE